MSRYVPGIDATEMFAVAEKFRNKCLLGGGSIFTDEKIWVTSNNEELINNFVNNPDESDLNFLDKLKIQLKPTSSNTKKLAAEILYVLNLCPTNTGQAKKREIVKEVYEWSGSELDLNNKDLSDSTLHGVGSAGTAFNTLRWREFSYFVNFIKSWMELHKDQKENLAHDPWAFGEWLESIPENEARQFRHMLLYLLFPDYYERIFGGTDRVSIISTFTGERRKDIRKKYSALDVDKKLYEIRGERSRVLGTAEIDFYKSPLDSWRDSNEEGDSENSIPDNITRDHILSAISKIDLDGIPKNAKSTTYDLIHDGKLYPPKYVVSLANLFANGIVLNRDTFEGGLGTPCFKLLEQNGFKIKTKTDSQRPKVWYVFQGKTYNELQGKKYLWAPSNKQLLHWIAMTELRAGDLVVHHSNGVKAVSKVKTDPYPAINEFAENEWGNEGIRADIEILFEFNPSISVATLTDALPNINSLITDIRGPFNKSRSNQGYLYEFNFNALREILILGNGVIPDVLRKYFEGDEMTGFIESKKMKINSFFDDLVKVNLQFNPGLVSRLVALLCTKNFVILTGLSGSGKTKIAQAFATWVSKKDNNQFLIIPVGADWTNREPLLGYPNALNSGEYIKPDSGVLDLLIKASKNPDQPYFLILDEMNLSHVERYFSDFLSLMESDDELKLHSSESILNVPKTIQMPKNLFIIGTVNIDETTYMFSPKVLDRAGVIEFRVNSEDMSLFLKNPIRPNLNEMAGLGSSMATDFVRIATENSPRYENQDAMNKELLIFFDQLKMVGAEFGYRTAYEINRFAGIISALSNGDCSHEAIIDAAIIQKLLPKLHGSRNQLVPVLEKLAELCLKDEKIENVKAKLKADQVVSNDPDVKYPLSFEKIHRMHSRAIKDGFTSFAEA